MNSTPFAPNRNHLPTMDSNSMCSSEISDSLSNDTFAITRRASQDVLMEGRIDRSFTPRFRGVTPDIGFPDAHHFTRSSSSGSLGKRKVKFGGHKVINEGFTESITEDEMTIRWWSREDLDEIKKAAKVMSLKLRKLAKERGCHVETAFKKTSLMLTNKFQDLVKMSPSSPDQDLLHWSARNDGRRGLERFACRDYGISRKDDVLGTRAAVFQEQERQRMLKVAIVEHVAKVSKAKSRRSRTFSLFIGEADAQAAARGYTEKSSKRPKVSHELQHQRHVVETSPRRFQMDLLLTSSA